MCSLVKALAVFTFSLSLIIMTCTMSEGVLNKPVSANLVSSKIKAGEPIEYDNCVIEGYLNLSTLVLNKSVHFNSTKFKGIAEFKGTIFNDYAYFIGSSFDDSVDFRGSQFNGDANFKKSKFSEDVYFINSTFKGYAIFIEAQFNRSANFVQSKFMRSVKFFESQFNLYANFRNSTFNERTDFVNSRFNSNAYFSDCKFFSPTDFTNSSFVFVDFGESHFYNWVYFRCSNFKNSADFSKSKFNSSAYFEGAQFNNSARFAGSQFNGSANFSDIVFNKETTFSGSKFRGDAIFNYSKFKEDALFEDADFFKLYFKHVKYDKLDIRWHNIANFVYDDKAYLSLLENFKKLGYLEDYDSCYFQYRKEHRVQPWPGIGSTEASIRKFFEIFLEYGYGYGKKPHWPLAWSLIVILIFSIYWFIIWKRKQVVLDEYNSTKNKINKIFLKNFPKIDRFFKVFIDFWLIGLIGMLINAFLFSAVVFLSGTKLFIDPPEVPDSRSLTNFIYIFERVLGAFFSILFFLAVGETIIR